MRPTATIQKAPYFKLFSVAAVICNGEFLYLAVKAYGYEEFNLGADAVLFALYNGIAHTVAAGVIVKLGLYGGPAGIPNGVAVLDIKVASAQINRHVVVAVTGNAAEPCVLIEAVAARSVGNKGEKSLCAEIVDPRVGGFGGGDDILTVGVVKMTEFHRSPVLSLSLSLNL